VRAFSGTGLGMHEKAILLELLLGGFFAVACIRAHGPFIAGQNVTFADFFKLSDRLERLKRSRWQWFSMVLVLLVLRTQQTPPLVRKDNETFQALRDAVRVRELLFSTLPQIHSAYFRVYRQSGREPPELIITGVSSRGSEPPASLDSLVMRAKLLGFHFSLDDGTLRALQAREGDLELAI